MRNFILLILTSVLFNSCGSIAPTIKEERPLRVIADVNVEKDKVYIQSGCSIYRARVHTFPGDYCIFLDDGSFISASLTALRRFGPDKVFFGKYPDTSITRSISQKMDSASLHFLQM